MSDEKGVYSVYNSKYSANHDISSNANCYKNLLNLRNIGWKLYTAAQFIKYNTTKTVNQV
jgi:hypothetical protein